jgi:hypothetical protein
LKATHSDGVAFWEERIARSATLWLVGCAALALGVSVYLIDRSASHAQWLPQLRSGAAHRWFGEVGGWLPSFAHAFAFSLFSAALLSPRPYWQYGACGFWLAVNAVFEVGQHPQVREPLADALRRGVGQGPLARSVENYFLRGTFDIGDLVAAALGAAMAAATLRFLRIHRENHRDP